MWIHAIPYWRGYRVRQEILQLDGGANTHRLVKVPLEQIEEWDKTHDPLGRSVDDAVSSGEKSPHGEEKRSTVINESNV